MMTHRQRLETAWSFREPDRVPIEANISPHSKRHPAAARVLKLIAEHADNLASAPAIQYGFFGIPIRKQERLMIEEEPGVYQKFRTRLETEAGVFTAVTYHPVGDVDYHWEKRYVSTVDEFRLLADFKRPPLNYTSAKWREAVAKIGDNALPITNLPHPLGHLVRNASMEEVYGWFISERDAMHRFLASANDQVAEGAERMLLDGIGPYFHVTAHEMLIPPWMGHALFDEFVFPYDKRVNDVIHKHGGKIRAHCHGRCMDFLQKMCAMGIDAIEPLEQPPAGDVDLAEAKKRVGSRMMLCGNIPSERFATLAPAAVRGMVRKAIADAAPGGGFALRTSGGHLGTCAVVPDDVMERILNNAEAYLLAGIEFGAYPVKD